MRLFLPWALAPPGLTLEAGMDAPGDDRVSVLFSGSVTVLALDFRVRINTATERPQHFRVQGNLFAGS